MIASSSELSVTARLSIDLGALVFLQGISEIAENEVPGGIALV
jgi:hypothetical protein